MWLFKLTLLQALGASVTEPRVGLEYRPGGVFVLGQETYASCAPTGVFRWGPRTVHWDVWAGVEFKAVSLRLGHLSNHRLIGEYPAKDLKSFEYIRLEYKKEF